MARWRPWRRTHDRALFNIGSIPPVQSWAGVSVTPDRALRLSTVWGCVRLLSDSVSTLPLAVYRDDERDPLPTPRLLQRPSADHPELSDWLWATMACLLLRGNAWGMISDRSGAGLLPAQVDLLDPTASACRRTATRRPSSEWTARRSTGASCGTSRHSRGPGRSWA